MKELIDKISKISIEFEDLEFQRKIVVNNFLGTTPASEDEIQLAEKRLNIRFPKEYREFLLITNGFIGPNDVEPSFCKIAEVDYLKNVIPEINEAYQIDELETAIIVGGLEEEQQFFLIPPDSKSQNWRYWKFSNWNPGEEEYPNLQNYFEKVYEFLIESNA